VTGIINAIKNVMLLSEDDGVSSSDGLAVNAVGTGKLRDWEFLRRENPESHIASEREMHSSRRRTGDFTKP
jgi:hypothetical protein